MKLIVQIGYWFFIIAFILLAALVALPLLPVTKYQVRIVQSGSMEPAISTGSIVVIAPQDSYGENDVITFAKGRQVQGQLPTTHRIVGTRLVDGSIFYTTKGDANDSADASEIQDRNIIGKVLFDIPYLGYVLAFAKQPLGFGILIGIPALVLVVDEVNVIRRELAKRKKKRHENDLSADNNTQTEENEEEG